MKDFSRGVSYYTKGTVEIGFPEDDIVCKHCPLMGMELKIDRAYCKRTGEYLVAPNFVIGTSCPIKFNDEINEVGSEVRNEGRNEERSYWDVP